MPIAVSPTQVHHIAYSPPGPEKLEHDGLRVSYRLDTGVFVCKYNSYGAGGEFQDAELSESSLKVLKNVVPWLWRPGMPLKYDAMTWGQEHDFESESRKLEVKLTPTDPEDIQYELEVRGRDMAPCSYSDRILKRNRAAEWVTSEPPEMSVQHLLWYQIILVMQKERDLLDKRQIDEPRVAIPVSTPPWQGALTAEHIIGIRATTFMRS